MRAALERRLGRSLEEVRRLVERQKKTRALEEGRARLQASSAHPPSVPTVHTARPVAPPPRLVVTQPFVDPPGFSLVKTIGLFFAVAPTQVTLLDNTVLGDLGLRIGLGVLEILSSLREVSKSHEFIIAAVRSGNTLSLNLLPDSKSPNSTDTVVTVTQFYTVEDKIISVETGSCSDYRISDYTWCLLKRVKGVVDRDGVWRIGHAGAAATLRIFYSNNAT